MTDQPDRRMFANGTEGAAWMRVWCEMCVHEDTCGYLDVIWSGDTPDVITLATEPPFHLPALHVCSAFTPNGEDQHAEIRERVRSITLGGSE